MAASVSRSYVVANRGPLTTIFTPPGSCLTETTLVSYPTNISLLVPPTGTFTASTLQTVQLNTTKVFINHLSWGDGACYPSTIQVFDGSTRWNNGYYYSPGVCPSGWTSACHPQTSPFGFPTTFDAATTAVMCCPQNWDCVTNSGVIAAHGCSTVLTSGQTLTSVWAAPQPTPLVPLDIPTLRQLTSWVVPNNSTAVCDGIPILYQATDLAVLAHATSAAPSSLTSDTIPTATSTTPAADAPSSSGLSTGAKAAIGVVIPIVCIALILGIFLFFRRRKVRHTHELDSDLATSGIEGADGKVGRSDPWEARHPDAKELTGTNAVYEKPGYLERPAEADGSQYIRELDGDTTVAYELPDYTSLEASSITRKQIGRSLTDDGTPYGSPGAPHSATSAAASPYAGPSTMASPAMSQRSADAAATPRSSVAAATAPIMSAEDSDAKLAILRDRIDRVRAEKDRLNRLDELEGLEKELQQEILQRQKQSMGF